MLRIQTLKRKILYKFKGFWSTTLNITTQNKDIVSTNTPMEAQTSNDDKKN
jgi:hypothetical protein